MATARAERAKTPEQESGHSGRLLLRMPPALHGELARAAERDGSSLNAFITRILSDAVVGGSPRAAPPPQSGSKLMRIALVADLVLVAVAAIAAVALLLVASL